MKRTKTKWFANALLTKFSLGATGLFLVATSSALATVRYVNVNNANPTPPYTNWATAATNIQDAVAAAGAGDEIVVTNGTYAGGSWVDPHGVTNRVVVAKPLTLQSVNGPDVTVIVGGGVDWVRCLYLTNNAMMVGFTLTNGGAYNGGGVYCETNAVLTNCVLTGNLAGAGPGAGAAGGGAYGGTLNNCTLTGNSAEYGGGAYDCTLNNSTLTGNSAWEGGGGAEFCTLNNCTLTGNGTWSDGDGGGAYYSTLNSCSLSGNSAFDGGGACKSTLNNCTLTDNWASDFGIWVSYGGGADFSTLNNCTLTGNSASYGGGTYSGALSNCTLTANSAPNGLGGGACAGTLNNCALASNSAWEGGGAEFCTLNNCTLTGNSAADGGGAYFCALNNCIVYFNSDTNGGNYDPSSTLNYSCTTPMPPGGVGNISADPQLASAWNLSALSPCIGTGNATYASGTDIDGDAWNNPPSIGCEEYHAGAVTGPLTVSLTATCTSVLIGNPVGLTASIAGRTDLSVWDFGDSDVEVNLPYTSHTWTAPGDYVVALWAYNDSYPEGVSATVTIYVDEGVHYVAASSANPVAPYTYWATAATNIQDAVNVAAPGATVFVTNGTYAPVTVNTPLTLQSVNGPDVTVINGRGAARCLYLTNDAVVGFTLTNGNVGPRYGGGVYCGFSSAVLSNCVLTGNSAFSGGGAFGGTLNNCTLKGNSTPSGGLGGGASGSTLNNCILSGNSAYGGGGATSATLNNCTLTGNSADYGGGVYGGTLNNCVLTGNSGGALNCALNNCVVSGNTDAGADLCTLNNCTVTGNSAWGASSATLNNCIVYFNGSNYDPLSTLSYCCTTPMPTNGLGNITNAPLFVDYAGANLCLQSNSPCINAGNNAYVVGSTDLDGNPRIVSGTVDIGAYEYQTPVSMISYAWLRQYGLPITTNIGTADLDGTAFDVYQDWIAGLNPTNRLSVLRMVSVVPQGANMAVTWQSVAGINYFLECSTNLATSPCFWCVATNLPGWSNLTTFVHTNAIGPGPLLFYRVGVNPP